jgi:cytochrome c biogenesis protein CcmG, thiol:disulfide interchange protein DsbE
MGHLAARCDTLRCMRSAAVIVLAAAVAAAGCGGASNDCGRPSEAETSRAFRGTPPPLAALHRQANQLLAGGRTAYEARLRALRGHPVVVNKWGSWCGPCRAEFPLFQRAALRLGSRVAFVGIDSQDYRGDARKFLACRPVSYPSYEDPDLKIASALRAPAQAFPTTIFYDALGQLVYAHPGPYEDLADLLVDVRRYAGPS